MARARRAVLLAIAIVVAAGALGLGAVGALAASAQSVACSPSGDSCRGLYVRAGKVVVQTRLAERYLTRSRLCVLRPGERRLRCRVVPVRPSGGIWVAQSAFPLTQRGTYRSPGYGTPLRVTATRADLLQPR